MARAYYPSGSDFVAWTPAMIGSQDANGLVQAASSQGVATLTDFAKGNQSFCGSVMLNSNSTWYNLISCRHRNNTGDGLNYGMILYAPLTSTSGNLTWQQQANGTWGNARTIADSQNPEIVVSSSQPSNANAKIWVQV